MKKINNNSLIVNEVPSTFKHKLIGNGASGHCYLTKDGTIVYKELHNDLLDKFNMKEFTKLESDYISFPRTIVYQDKIDDDNIIGYLSNYVEGKTFDKISDSESIKSIITASDKLEKEIRKISFKGVLMEDVNNPSNVIFTKNKELKIIDTDLYEICLSEEPFCLYKANLREWGNFIMNALKSYYPYENSNLNDYFTRLIYYGKVKPSYVLNYMLNEMNKISKREITTLGEYKEGQKLIKKL